MEFDLSKSHCAYFNTIASIPHGSLNEKALSNYLVEFAKKQGLKYLQDELFNVIIYKPSQNHTSDEALIIQAHIDMVCEKNKGTVHNFETDGLKLEVNDGWLSAKGTTLGADDGHGVAYMLAILADNKLSHPPLECVFTTQEEIGLIGAMNLRKEDLSANRMISLDGGGETSTLLCSAGGARVTLTRAIKTKLNTNATYELNILGLLGGHSGGEIHKEKGNANKLLMRVLMELKLKGITVDLAYLNGGLKDNAIPREATAKFCSSQKLATIAEELRKIEKDLKVELEFSDPNIQLQLVEIEQVNSCYTTELSDAVIQALYLTPNGFQARSMAIEGLTMTSLNFGILEEVNQTIVAHISLRSALESATDHLIRQLATLANLFGFEYTVSARYPGWNYEAKSEMRDILDEVIQELYQKPLELKAAHGGCECGIFKALNPKMDIVSMGPMTEFIHTPDEKMNLASFDREYKVLTTYISKMK